MNSEMSTQTPNRVTPARFVQDVAITAFSGLVNYYTLEGVEAIFNAVTDAAYEMPTATQIAVATGAATSIRVAQVMTRNR